MTTDEATLVADPPPESGPPPRQRSVGDMVRTFFRGVGQTLITFGVVVLLFIVYEVWVTNWFSVRENHRLRTKLETAWANGQDPLSLPGSGVHAIPLGAGIANIYIPRLGQDFAWTIVQGGDPPSQDELAKGPAHYGQTQMPGDIGNFAVAGHRVGKGEPFLNLDHLKPGDAVIIETGKHWYVYRVKGVAGVHNGISKPNADGIPGSEVVGPDDGSPLYPIPHDQNSYAPLPATNGMKPSPSANQATERLMTMTTCTPKFTAENRLIVYAVLDPVFTAPGPDSGGKDMPQLIKDLYKEVKG